MMDGEKPIYNLRFAILERSNAKGVSPTLRTHERVNVMPKAASQRYVVFLEYSTVIHIKIASG
jgi:hypothetical protein